LNLREDAPPESDELRFASSGAQSSEERLGIVGMEHGTGEN
jgi:hypothetical protein